MDLFMRAFFAFGKAYIDFWEWLLSPLVNYEFKDEDE